MTLASTRTWLQPTSRELWHRGRTVAPISPCASLLKRRGVHTSPALATARVDYERQASAGGQINSLALRDVEMFVQTHMHRALPNRLQDPALLADAMRAFYEKSDCEGTADKVLTALGASEDMAEPQQMELFEAAKAVLADVEGAGSTPLAQDAEYAPHGTQTVPQLALGGALMCTVGGFLDYPKTQVSAELLAAQTSALYATANILHHWATPDGIQTAVMLYGELARLGHGLASFQLGIMRLTGEAMDQDYDRALKLFSVAAQRGVGEAYLQMAMMTHKGLGLSAPDLPLAQQYYQLARDNEVPGVSFPYAVALIQESAANQTPPDAERLSSLLIEALAAAVGDDHQRYEVAATMCQVQVEHQLALQVLVELAEQKHHFAAAQAAGLALKQQGDAAGAEHFLRLSAQILRDAAAQKAQPYGAPAINYDHTGSS
ncbi:uncharacterized protein MONBRDRAFT_7370 [Monosiga brevicollis MX1]|uniref:Uncharacterized protein n=1 Tax=Monosiga brevicollis TaxID=81824 RepID=A9UWR6_MONBE|nr:uncharacterized protein MONBRDRAFT_7370 [Monosiga brevicollis MX1]EDQ90261.1 predicted protein [Monosiga brevicollis MX1]|eukprot:XP_001745028.1 hypothetical protein [Monosiga brevicollis MX1]